MLYLSQIIILYTLNLHSAVCQSYLKKKKLEGKTFSNKGEGENSKGGKSIIINDKNKNHSFYHYLALIVLTIVSSLEELQIRYFQDNSAGQS